MILFYRTVQGDYGLKKIALCLFGISSDWMVGLVSYLPLNTGFLYRVVMIRAGVNLLLLAPCMKSLFQNREFRVLSLDGSCVHVDIWCGD